MCDDTTEIIVNTGPTQEQIDNTTDFIVNAIRGVVDEIVVNTKPTRQQIDNRERDLLLAKIVLEQFHDQANSLISGLRVYPYWAACMTFENGSVDHILARAKKLVDSKLARLPKGITFSDDCPNAF